LPSIRARLVSACGFPVQCRVVSVFSRSDIDQMLIRFIRAPGDSGLRLWTDIGSRASFVVETTFEPKDRGIYMMAVYLFWPGAGQQVSRAAITPIIID